MPYALNIDQYCCIFKIIRLSACTTVMKVLTELSFSIPKREVHEKNKHLDEVIEYLRLTK